MERSGQRGRRAQKLCRPHGSAENRGGFPDRSEPTEEAAAAGRGRGTHQGRGPSQAGRPGMGPGAQPQLGPVEGPWVLWESLSGGKRVVIDAGPAPPLELLSAPPGPPQLPHGQAGRLSGRPLKTETDPLLRPWPGPGGPEAVLPSGSPSLPSRPLFCFLTLASLPGFACWSGFPLSSEPSCRPTLGVTLPRSCPRGPPSLHVLPGAAPPYRVSDGLPGSALWTPHCPNLCSPRKTRSSSPPSWRSSTG